MLTAGFAQATIAPPADVYEGGDYANPDGMAPKVCAVHGFAKEAEPIARQATIDVVRHLFAD